MFKPKVYFIGIGGIGTSALARWFLMRGYNVSGSDISSSETTLELKRQGIKVLIGHKAKNVPKGAKLAIFSAAVSPDNPEIKQAKKLGIITKSYSEVLGDLTKQYKTLAVAGAHGKSTTTALLSLVLMHTRFDPTVIIGTKLKEFKSPDIKNSGINFRKGKSDYLVLEADEYQKSFLHYSPIAGIITNIDREHLDVYKNLNNIKNVFLKFIKNIQPGGILVVNKDDKNLFGLKNKIKKIAKQNQLKVFWYSVNIRKPDFAKLILTKSDFQKLRKILKIPGIHNLSNAMAVYTLARALGISQKKIFNAIAKYNGAWRRMEYRGTYDVPNITPSISGHRKSKILKIPIYDDYAHHPTEIKTTLAGISQKWPKTTIICVFQPHQGKRLSLLFKDFVTAFDAANVLILLPVYQVRGRDNLSQNMDYNAAQRRRKIPARFCNAINIIAKSRSSKDLAEAIRKHLIKTQNSLLSPEAERNSYGTGKLPTGQVKLKTIIYLPSPKKLSKVIKSIVISQKSKVIVVMMGAGDIYKMTDSLVK